MKDKVIIYTDGACKGNPGVGGWGAILSYKDKSKKIYGYEEDTTNNRMELTAAIQALGTLKFKSKVILHTDSKYLMDGINEWIKVWKENDWKTSNKKLASLLLFSSSVYFLSESFKIISKIGININA